jgi:hypothetical protein
MFSSTASTVLRVPSMVSMAGGSVASRSQLLSFPTQSCKLTSEATLNRTVGLKSIKTKCLRW